MQFLVQFLIVACLSNVAAQQPKYLMIRRTHERPAEISYPPGTAFQFVGEDSSIAVSQENLPGDYPISRSGILIVSPAYKKGTDRYYLQPGDVLVLESGLHCAMVTSQGKIAAGMHSNHVYLVKKDLSPAADPGLQNVVLTFSNDVIFSYFDGVARATRGDLELPVKGTYRIDLGNSLLKISYEPATGTVWYVAEPNL